jgi:hypothetical protein
MKRKGQIVVARGPESRVIGVGPGWQMSAYFSERLPKSLKKFAASPI